MSKISNVIHVYGIVQGVGFRPFVSRIADADGISGSVANKGSYVEIFAQGTVEQMQDFLRDLEEKAPERSAILKVDVRECEPIDTDIFEIIESEHEAGDIFVSPDIATCPKCRQELYDPTNRRYMHPFINCTACGPRLTILDAMPYDRERTSMKEFPMCPECAFEYTHSETRRYDAQPVCCNDCGPEVYLLNREERGREAITYVRRAIMDGKIIAIKGIGGFHLCCDAKNEEAVARLRVLKHRPVKPFAVMMRDLEAVNAQCETTEAQREILDGHQKPIILLKKKSQSDLAASVAPGNPKIGVMLPYAPVQMLLFDYNDGLEMSTDCFVMTSGNVSGAPICRTDEDAEKELSGFCDIILSHNRKIRLRADDSVMDFYKGEPYMIRRSRGYAPLPVMLGGEEKGQVLAIGGELKNTFCLAKNQLLYESPYVGDMADLRTVKALQESVKRMEELLETTPELVVCDLHPKYNTTVVAEQQGLPVLKLQHHYAHILSCMAENDVTEPVLGVSFDGTGYGTDGTIWGGEFLLADTMHFERLGSIYPFLHVGGDLASKEGWRIAASMLHALLPEELREDTIKAINLCEPKMVNLIGTMAQRRINSIASTSAGRLFDAVSAILGICRQSTFEGEASTKLEFAAEAYEEERSVSLKEENAEFRKAAGWLTERTCSVYDGREDFFFIRTDLLVRYIVDQRLKGMSANRLAWQFHLALADMITGACCHMAELTGVTSVALSGGVFQNQLLLRLCDELLSKKGFKVYRHHLIPPNDGGLALGQAYAGLMFLNAERERPLS